MGGLSVWHWALVALVFVLLFGARRLPDLARSLGQSKRILRAELSAGDPDGDRVPSAAQPKPSPAE